MFLALILVLVFCCCCGPDIFNVPSVPGVVAVTSVVSAPATSGVPDVFGIHAARHFWCCWVLLFWTFFLLF
jgi:hypothetical protein